MKKRFSFLLVLVLVSALAGCSSGEAAVSPTPAPPALSVDDMAAELEAAMYGVYDVELKVYYLSDKFTVQVTGKSNVLERSQFGAVIGLVGDRFLELIEEYPEISFDDVTFSYYGVARMGGKLSDNPALSYHLVADDGGGFFIQNTPETYSNPNMTPDEVFEYLKKK